MVVIYVFERAFFSVIFLLMMEFHHIQYSQSQIRQIYFVQWCSRPLCFYRETFLTLANGKLFLMKIYLILGWLHKSIRLIFQVQWSQEFRNVCKCILLDDYKRWQAQNLEWLLYLFNFLLKCFTVSSLYEQFLY